mmetsp:Transcript_11160/g.16548  ORF Transcript_11160/g.16548 Transcript_11160/m.16548 type:complete len:276 (+) Transcript_11160:114-941(+)|eukprot:scaffold5260_cov71-Skeletonema_dohrnii-CCMP3373.AAC.1
MKSPAKPQQQQRSIKKKNKCSHPNCTNWAVKSSICIKHGATPSAPRRCTHPSGCTNYARSQGLCIKHGATWTKKICSVEGCQKYAKRNGVCISHGAKVERKVCGVAGCNSKVVREGVCQKHGAKREYKQCSAEDCTNLAVLRGVCVKHGAKRKYKLCEVEDCTNLAQKRGLCKRHGAYAVDAETVEVDVVKKMDVEEAATSATKQEGTATKPSTISDATKPSPRVASKRKMTKTSPSVEQEVVDTAQPQNKKQKGINHATEAAEALLSFTNPTAV